MFIAASIAHQFPFAFVTFQTKHADNGARIVVIVTVDTLTCFSQVIDFILFFVWHDFGY
jgi:hypothetical protein